MKAVDSDCCGLLAIGALLACLTIPALAVRLRLA
jgi:hypothetical protein